MILIGLMLGLIGTDIFSGAQRYTFGWGELSQGIEFVVVAMGLFGIGEVIRNLEHEHRREAFVRTVTGVWPSRADLNRIVAPISAWIRDRLCARTPSRRGRPPCLVRRLRV